MVPARGCLVQESIPAVYRLLSLPHREKLDDPSCAESLAAEIERRFFEVRFLLTDERFLSFVEEETNPNEFIRALATDTVGEIVGKVGTAIDGRSPVLQEAIERLRPRVHTTGAVPGEVLQATRLGLLSGRSVAVKPELEINALIRFPNDLTAAFRWYERVCRGDKPYSWAELTETDRCFRIALWWRSVFDTSYDKEPASFLAACSRMLEEVSDFDEYDVEMEQAIENLLDTLAGDHLVPVGQPGDGASVAVLAQGETRDDLDRSRIWPHPDRPRCRWHLPGFKPTSQQEAVPPRARKEIRELHPIWNETLRVAEKLGKDGFRSKVHAAFHAAGNDPSVHDIGRLVAEIVTPLQAQENLGCPTRLEPSSLDDYLELVEQQEFRDGRLTTLTRLHWQANPEDARGFRLRTLRMPGAAEEGDSCGLRDRGARIVDGGPVVLEPAVVESSGPIHLELFYLRALEPLVARRDFVEAAFERARPFRKALQEDPEGLLCSDEQHRIFFRVMLLGIGTQALEGSRPTPAGAFEPDYPLHIYLIYLKLFDDLQNDLSQAEGRLNVSWKDHHLSVTGNRKFISIQQLRHDKGDPIFHAPVPIHGDWIRKLAAGVVRKRE